MNILACVHLNVDCDYVAIFFLGTVCYDNNRDYITKKTFVNRVFERSCNKVTFCVKMFIVACICSMNKIQCRPSPALGDGAAEGLFFEVAPNDGARPRKRPDVEWAMKTATY